MPNKLFLLFNHAITTEQEMDARASLGVDSFLEPPANIKELWGNVPPEVAELRSYLEPILRWLEPTSQRGDFVLIQGDFGASYLVVSHALDLGLVPIYATTVREASEELQSDGSVALTHRFRHVRFRKYGE
jgi:hypothetical protein